MLGIQGKVIEKTLVEEIYVFRIRLVLVIVLIDGLVLAEKAMNRFLPGGKKHTERELLSTSDYFTAYRFDYLVYRREYSKNYFRSPINHRFPVYQDFIFPVLPVNLLNINTQFAFDPGRYTIGMESRDSICAITNRNSRHPNLQRYIIYQG
jgi:hypothetical protein